MRSTFIKALTEVACDDERLVLLTGDLGFKVFDDFRNRYPARFYNMGVSEANMTAVAAGLALSGWRPFTYSIVPFATVRCLEQIRNDICNMNAPVVVTGAGGGFAYGPNGPTHHGIDDVAVMRAMPGMTVVCPCDPREVTGAVGALVALGAPAYLRLARNGEPLLPGTDAPFRLGVPNVLCEGRRVAILACGPVAAEALAAAGGLKSRGIEPFVLSVHTVKPLGTLPDFLYNHGIEAAFVVEEHGPCGGLFEAVCAALGPRRDRPFVVALTAPDRFAHAVGSQQFMWGAAGLDADAISRKVIETLEGL